MDLRIDQMIDNSLLIEDISTMIALGRLGNEFAARRTVIMCTVFTFDWIKDIQGIDKNDRFMSACYFNDKLISSGSEDKAFIGAICHFQLPVMIYIKDKNDYTKLITPCKNPHQEIMYSIHINEHRDDGYIKRMNTDTKIKIISEKKTLLESILGKFNVNLHCMLYKKINYITQTFKEFDKRNERSFLFQELPDND